MIQIAPLLQSLSQKDPKSLLHFSRKPKPGPPFPFPVISVCLSDRSTRAHGTGAVPLWAPVCHRVTYDICAR